MVKPLEDELVSIDCCSWSSLRRVGPALWGTALLLVAAAGLPAFADTPKSFIDPPVLADAVSAGRLPPVAERLPSPPRVMDLSGDGLSPGRHGGSLVSLIRKEKDAKLISIYGYARLVGYDRHYALVPDILESVKVDEGRRFEFRLRAGHRWSDGAPFTAEDFRFWWEDVALNTALNPGGPPSTMLVEDEAPTFQMPDARTVIYTWSRPNPDFLDRLAGASPLFIYAPAHHLKPIHAAYADPAALKERVEASGRSDWVDLFDASDNLYFSNDPSLPTLQPWVNTSKSPTTRFVARRNPYFHRVDAAGRQLPYIDELVLPVTQSGLIPVKTGAGESHLQSRGISLSDYVFLRQGEERNGYTTRLWKGAVGSQLSFYLNMNAADPVWRGLARDPQFRRALSLGVNRGEISQVMFYGLALEAADTVLPDSPLFDPKFASAWAEHDPARANAMLDAIGLTVGDDGLRQLPDGRPLELVAETAGESTLQTDILELVRDSWAEIGVKLLIRPMQRELLRKRTAAGETVLAIWFGLTNGVPTAQTSPKDLVPFSRYDFQWPQWGAYFESGGKMGSAPEIDSVQRLADLYEAWRSAKTPEAQHEAWREILEIRADQVFTIGTVSGVGQPVTVDNRLRNVPQEAIYNWHPGAFFGIYNPDTFWFDEE